MDVKDLNETYERLQIAVKCPAVRPESPGI